MEAIADAAGSLGNFGGAGGSAEVRVNGHLVKSRAFRDDPRASNPILLDVSAFLTPGENHIEVIPAAAVGSAIVRLVESHWTPWTQSRVRSSAELRFSVKFGRTDARASVRAERVGFRGYGMLLAEVGLPPRAEVDRGSLESLLADRESGLDRYEILPDRIVFYLWPEAGGVSFEFWLSARMTMKAKSAGSVLYDYYNPEELTEMPPETFVIR
jgi:hypothetical protein